MAASQENYILEIFQNGYFSKTAAKKDYLRNSKLHIFYISETNFYGFLLGKGFREKSKHIELALNFIQKQ